MCERDSGVRAWKAKPAPGGTLGTLARATAASKRVGEELL